jgi:hypothetical protein
MADRHDEIEGELAALKFMNEFKMYRIRKLTFDHNVLDTETKGIVAELLSEVVRNTDVLQELEISCTWLWDHAVDLENKIAFGELRKLKSIKSFKLQGRATSPAALSAFITYPIKSLDLMVDNKNQDALITGLGNNHLIEELIVEYEGLHFVPVAMINDAGDNIGDALGVRSNKFNLEPLFELLKNNKTLKVRAHSISFPP